MAAAVDRRVMVETPDLKADFAVNLPRTGALRNRGKLAIPRRIRRDWMGMPGKICYELCLNLRKRHRDA
jgi:hypothetical protein